MSHFLVHEMHLQALANHLLELPAKLSLPAIDVIRAIKQESIAISDYFKSSSEISDALVFAEQQLNKIKSDIAERNKSEEDGN